MQKTSNPQPRHYNLRKLSWRRTQPYAIVINALWVPLSVGLLIGPRKTCHETLSWAYGTHEGGGTGAFG
eukprot:3722650-Pyramimonas_sp.AAC.1